MFKKIDDTMIRNKRKTLGLANNLMAGIITGGLIGQMFPLLQKSQNTNIFITNLVLTLVFLFVGYFVGKGILRYISKDEKEDFGYRSNFLAGFVASVYASILPLVSSSWKWYFLGIPVVVFIIIVILYNWAKLKRN